jgi:hypothetical protein
MLSQEGLKMDAYTNRELQSLPDDAWPTRGPLCEKCHTHIPALADLAPAQEESLRQLAKQSSARAILELRRITGCNLRWAKIWVSHPNGPQTKHGVDGPPCPYCGAPLRTDKAKQCISCGTDWHNPDNVIQHGNPPPNSSVK